MSAFIAFEYFFEKNYFFEYFFENFFETFGMIKPLCNRDIGHSTLILSFHGAILQALLPTKELLNVKFHSKIPVSMKFIFPGMELVLFSVLHFELCTFLKLFTSPPENVYKLCKM